MTDTVRRLAGSVFFIEGANLWRAVLALPKGPDGKRRQWVTSSRVKEVAEAALETKRAALIAEGVIVDNSGHPVRSRRQNEEAARALGSHTKRERARLVQNLPESCRYCDTRIDWLNYSIDHEMPIACGGSDSIENLQAICWQCNFEKGNALGWSYSGEKPRPYKMTAHNAAHVARVRANFGGYRA